MKHSYLIFTLKKYTYTQYLQNNTQMISDIMIGLTSKMYTDTQTKFMLCIYHEVMYCEIVYWCNANF